MKSEKLKFLIVENAEDVCEGIERRMKPFENWQSIGYCTGLKETLTKIALFKPHLIFLDWSLNGGSAFEVLQQIQNTSHYNPYIIFNTGFQSDHPEIPQEIINKYSVDKYLVKPFWENLRQNMPSYLKEAEEKARQCQEKPKIVWVKNESGFKIPLSVNKIICVLQHPLNPRRRNFYVTTEAKEITISWTWDRCYELLDANNIDYFVTKSREHLVVKDFIEKFERPFVRLRGVPLKVEVVKEKLREFTDWLQADKVT
jgi:two-component system, LytTR family, response regulator